MKQNFTILIILCLHLVAIGQQVNNLIVFAEDATPFYVILNGMKQNLEPQTNVKVEGIASDQNQIKVIFENTEIPTINKSWYAPEMNVEATFKIANTKKGYKLRYFGDISMGAAPVNPEQNIVAYHTQEEVMMTTSTPVETSRIVVTEEVITVHNPETKTNVFQDTENIDVNMNISGLNVNMGVHVKETNGGVDAQNSSSVITTSTTTTTTTTSGVDIDGDVDNSAEVVTDAVKPLMYVEGYTGAVGCSVPSNSMTSIRSAIDNESFSDDKMRVAKQAVNNKCLTAAQVIELGRMFDFEDDKLSFAKYAYSRTYDVDNYYQVNSLFDFSDSKEELGRYIGNK